MKLEQQVCSLELAKKLKELGIKQDAYFSWRCFDAGGPELSWIICKSDDFPEKIGIANFGFGSASAFSCVELGELLPNMVTMFRVHKKFDMHEGKWACGDELETSYAVTEADSRAQFLIHLIEQGIVQPSGGSQ